jgi:hypothetical protein
MTTLDDLKKRLEELEEIERQQATEYEEFKETQADADFKDRGKENELFEAWNAKKIKIADLKIDIKREKEYQRKQAIANQIKTEITEAEKGIPEESRAILKNPQLFKTITETELDKTIVGEHKTRKAIFLTGCYIWVDDDEIPPNIIVTSESSAGKSYICKQIFKLFPTDKKEYRTKITPEAFTYWHNSTYEPDWNWNGEICYLEDATQAILNSETFKVMCSEGSTATVVIKQRAIDIEIKGKPVIWVTTASSSPKAEILNRFSLAGLNETIEQTEKITYRQAVEAEKGKKQKYDPQLLGALTQLKRVKVRIPYAKQVWAYLKQKSQNTFSYLRLRRDFPRFLMLIKASAALHQYQRKIDDEGHILANWQDYKYAAIAISCLRAHTFLSLTHRIKKAYECCKQLKTFTAKEIYSKFPFVNQSMWYNNLNKLCERNLLTITLESEEGVKQKVTTYHVVDEVQLFELPPKIENIVKVKIDRKVKKVKKVKKVDDLKSLSNNFNNYSSNLHSEFDWKALVRLKCSVNGCDDINCNHDPLNKGEPRCYKHFGQLTPEEVA